MLITLNPGQLIRFSLKLLYGNANIDLDDFFNYRKRYQSRKGAERSGCEPLKKRHSYIV